MHNLLLITTLSLLPGIAGAQQAPAGGGDAEIGVVEQLGAHIPLDLRFHDSQRNLVTLGELIDKPTILLLVYFRCPNICSPLMNEVAAMVDQLEGLEAGEDFELLTVSFDDREDLPENANVPRNGKKALLERMKKKIPPASWHFLTGSKENIAKLAAAVGFHFKQEESGDYTHPAVTIFLGADGKIVRYLPGVQLLASNVKMALIDAKEGRARSFMQTIQRLCFSYDPEGGGYVLQINRIILGGTGLLLAIFLGFLLLRRKRKPATLPAAATATSPLEHTP